jgi:hypothetical protein
MIVRCSEEPAIPEKHVALVRYVGRKYKQMLEWRRHERKGKEKMKEWIENTWTPDVEMATGRLEALYGHEYARLRKAPAADQVSASAQAQGRCARARANK